MSNYYRVIVKYQRNPRGWDDNASDRPGVTMHPAQPDWTFWQNRKCKQILLQKSQKETFHLYTYKEKQDENVDFIEYIGLIF